MTVKPRRTPPPPPSLLIGSSHYDVFIDQSYLDAESAKSNSHGFAGLSSLGEQRIVLAEAMAGDYARDTLLHEVIHQCFRASGSDPDADAKAGVEDIEERAIVAISGPLLGALRNNPDLLAYLLADTPG